MDSLYIAVPALLLLLWFLAAWFSVRRVRSLSASSRPGWRRAAEGLVLSLALLLLGAVAGNSAYNAVAIQRFLATNPPRGKLYPVNGRSMHLYCVGIGQPMIILEPGLGPATDVLSWSSLQPRLAATTRVCSYDRAGLGWSAPRTGPADADRIAADLHALLKTAGVGGPLVLIGSSYGGICIRDYTAHYPADVAGLVFIDSSTPFQEERFHALGGADGEQNPARRMAILHSEYLLGIPRLVGWCSRPVPGWEIRTARALGEDACIAHYEGVREFLSMEQSSRETVHAGPFGDLPILIFSHDPSSVLSMRSPPEQWVAREQLWNAMQEELKRLSTRGRRIVARASGHGVHVDREDLVVREVGMRSTKPEFVSPSHFTMVEWLVSLRYDRDKEGFASEAKRFRASA
ncbi:MAG: alpha/beta hydrolase [Bryobacteraceae bacterium]